MRKMIFDAFTARADNNTQESILWLLKDADYHHRVTRGELVDKLHLTDRAVREQIEKMRKNGIFIAGDMERAGYFIPQTMEQFLAFEAKYSRALTTLYNKGQMHNLAAEIFSGQTKLEVDA